MISKKSQQKTLLNKQAPLLLDGKEYQHSDKIIKAVVLQEKINSLLEDPVPNEDLNIITDENGRKRFSRKVSRSSLEMIYSKKPSFQNASQILSHSETLINENNNNNNIYNSSSNNNNTPKNNLLLQSKLSSIVNLKTMNEILPEINEENHKSDSFSQSQNSEETKEKCSIEQENEDVQHYLRSGFTKDDIFSTTLDFSDYSENFSQNKNIPGIKKSLMQSSFKNKLDVDTFLGKKFKEKRNMRIREGFCYENFDKFKEKTKRCPCYSNCEIF